MPHDSRWVNPKRFIMYGGLQIYHTYQDNDISMPAHTLVYTLDERCDIGHCGGKGKHPERGPGDCNLVFDVRELPDWKNEMLLHQGSTEWIKRMKICLKYHIKNGNLTWKGIVR